MDFCQPRALPSLLPLSSASEDAGTCCSVSFHHPGIASHHIGIKESRRRRLPPRARLTPSSSRRGGCPFICDTPMSTTASRPSTKFFIVSTELSEKSGHHLITVRRRARNLSGRICVPPRRTTTRVMVRPRGSSSLNLLAPGNSTRSAGSPTAMTPPPTPIALAAAAADQIRPRPLARRRVEVTHRHRFPPHLQRIVIPVGVPPVADVIAPPPPRARSPRGL